MKSILAFLTLQVLLQNTSFFSYSFFVSVQNSHISKNRWYHLRMVTDNSNAPMNNNNSDKNSVNIEKDNFQKILEKVKQYDSEWLKQTLGDSLIDMLVKDSERTSPASEQDRNNEEEDDCDRGVETYSVSKNVLVESIQSSSTVVQSSQSAVTSQQPIIEKYITDISNAGDALAVVDITAEKRIIEQVRQIDTQSSSVQQQQQQQQFSLNMTSSAVNTGGDRGNVISGSGDLTFQSSVLVSSSSSSPSSSIPSMSSMKTEMTINNPTLSTLSSTSPISSFSSGTTTTTGASTTGDNNSGVKVIVTPLPPPPPQPQTAASAPKVTKVNNNDLLLYNRLIELGYNQNEIFSMKASVKKIVVDRRVKRPRKGLPIEWLEPVKPTPISSDRSSRSTIEDESTRGRSRRQVPSSESPVSSTRDRSGGSARQPPQQQSRQSQSNRRRNDDDDDVYSSNKNDDEFGGFASNYRCDRRRDIDSDSASGSNTAEGSNLFWPDKEEFKDLILEESRWRASLVGNFWLPSIKQEAKWRYFMYKKWKEFLDQGVNFGFETMDMPTFDNNNNQQQYNDNFFNNNRNNNENYDDEEEEEKVDEEEEDDYENEQRYAEYVKFTNSNKNRRNINEENDADIDSDSRIKSDRRDSGIKSNIYRPPPPPQYVPFTKTAPITIAADSDASTSTDYDSSDNNDYTQSPPQSQTLPRIPPIPVTIIPDTSTDIPNPVTATTTATSPAVSAEAAGSNQSKGSSRSSGRDEHDNNYVDDRSRIDNCSRDESRSSDSRVYQRNRGVAGSSSRPAVPSRTDSYDNRNSNNYDDSNTSGMRRRRRNPTTNNNNNSNSRRSSSPYSNNNNNNNNNKMDDVRIARDRQRERAYDEWLQRTLSEQEGWTDLSTEQRNIIQNRKKAKFLEREYKKRTENQLTDKMDWFSDLDRNPNRNRNRYDDDDEDDDFIFEDGDDYDDDDDYDDISDRRRRNNNNSNNNFNNMAMSADRRSSQYSQSSSGASVSRSSNMNINNRELNTSNYGANINRPSGRSSSSGVDIRYTIPLQPPFQPQSQPSSPATRKNTRRLRYDEEEDYRDDYSISRDSSSYSSGDGDDYGSKTNFKWNSAVPITTAGQQRLSPLQQQRQAVMKTVANRNINNNNNNLAYDDDDEEDYDNNDNDDEVNRQMIRSVTQLAAEEEAFRVAWEASATRRPIQ